jgi:hypothetical protein
LNRKAGWYEAPAWRVFVGQCVAEGFAAEFVWAVFVDCFDTVGAFAGGGVADFLWQSFG